MTDVKPTINMNYMQPYLSDSTTVSFNAFPSLNASDTLWNEGVTQTPLPLPGIFGQVSGYQFPVQEFNPFGLDSANMNFSLPPMNFMPSNFDWQKGLQTALNMQQQYMENLKSKMAMFFGMMQQNGFNSSGNIGWSQSAEELKSKWASKKPNLSDQFYAKVVAIANRINCSPDALMALMNAESGLNPKAVNSNGGATGLIQFMPDTAASLGTSTPALKMMSAEQQLDYVEKYLVNAKRGANFGDAEQLDAATLYAIVFLPARAKQDILTREGEKYYEANKNLGSNGMITKADLARKLQQFSA